MSYIYRIATQMEARKEVLSKVYLPPDRMDEMARLEEEMNKKAIADKTDGHAVWDFRGLFTFPVGYLSFGPIETIVCFL